MQKHSFFDTTKRYILYVLLFLFPLFFLPITQEYFVTNKLYLLAYGSLLLLVVSAIEIVMNKKIHVHKENFDIPVVLFAVTVALSTLIASPNKFQALLNPNFGVVLILSFTILYFFISRLKNSAQTITLFLNFTSILLSLIAVIFFFNPFQNASLPFAFQFLKNPSFTPLGNQIDLIIFLGFVLVMNIGRLMYKSKTEEQDESSIIRIITTVLGVLGIILSIVSIYKGSNAFKDLLLPPYKLSWYAAVEILKNPVTALFGIGIDNFSSVFSRIKDIDYNNSILWQVPTFNSARSTILHIMTEAGIFSIVAFGLLMINLYKVVMAKERHLVATIIYIAVMFLLFPPSLTLFFILYLSIAMISALHTHHTPHEETENTALLPLYIGSAILILALVAGASYLLGRSYLAEYRYKQSLDVIAGISKENVYELQRSSILLNPYIERYRIDFSRLNLLLANNVASKDPKKLTDADRQTIAQAIQAAITEAKNVVSLNPQKAVNWQNLAVIYRNVLNVAQGADAWTVSAYQRAIVADPQNPSYRLDLGGIFYSLQNYDDAIRMFEQSVGLKQDWPNAHYNLAWALYQKGEYVRAATEIQNVLLLLDPKKDSADYKKAQEDLVEFKKKVPPETQTTDQPTDKLSLPNNTNTATLEPKLKLDPKQASPEAK